MWIFLPICTILLPLHSFGGFYELPRFQAADHLYSLGPPRLRCPHHCFRHSQNNDTHLDGLTILAPGQNLAPTIYLDYYYGQYERGRSFSDITDDILTAYRENRPKSPVDISFFTDYDKVKSRVTMKLINYERNRELLKRVPYYRFLISPSSSLCLVESDSSGTATVLIHNEHLTYWGLPETTSTPSPWQTHRSCSAMICAA